MRDSWIFRVLVIGLLLMLLFGVRSWAYQTGYAQGYAIGALTSGKQLAVPPAPAPPSVPGYTNPVYPPYYGGGWGPHFSPFYGLFCFFGISCSSD